MTSDMPDHARELDSVMRQLMDTIDKHGWAIIATTSFAYTVGLTFLRVPELYVAGVTPSVAHSMLQVLAERQKRAGAFEPGQITRVPGVPGRSLRLDPMPLTDLGFVRVVFGDNKPVPPTALAVEVLQGQGSGV